MPITSQKRNKPKKTVDFLPVFTITGDIRKVSEEDAQIYNTKIFPVVSLLQIERGTNQLFPDMGCLELIQSIKYSDINEANIIVSEIVHHINIYTNFNVTGELKIPEGDTSVENKIVEFQLNIPGLPAPLLVRYDNSEKGGIIKIKHPSLFKL